MARIKSNGQIQGVVGSVSCRVVNGKNIMQSKSVNVKQTEDTKRNASQFGKVAKWTKTLRLPIQQAIGDNHDGGMYRRMNRVVVGSFNQNKQTAIEDRNLLNTDIGHLAGFDLNRHSSLFKYCNLPLRFIRTADKMLTIKMPAIETDACILFPLHTRELNIQITCTRTGFALNAEATVNNYFIPVYKDTAKLDAFVWDAMKFVEGEVLTVVVQMWCVRRDASQERQLLNCKVFNPSAIVFVDNGL